MHPRHSAALVAALLTVPALTPAQSGAAREGASIPAPASVIGFAPGTDRKLPTWKQVVEYFTALDRASPHIHVRTLGKTTMGRPFIAAFIGDSAALTQLSYYREIQRKLADPRLLRPGERDSLIANGKAVVLVTSSIHSTEVGGILTPLVLAHRLVSGDDDETREIRRNTITILVPSLNPDGVDIVGDWYRASLGTPWEGAGPPVLYHKYVGHDNNRDWYAFTQVETQMTVDSLHNVWHPQIVNDIHQQGAMGSRIFIPPYLDPAEPNVDPIIMAGVNQMGMAMTWRLIADGKTGVGNYASYDAWTPARSYQHYHGGIRILTETASARLATPITVPFDSMITTLTYSSRERSWNFLAPWPGGSWGIGDIIDYQTSATWALLSQAARDRVQWLKSFATVGERAVQGHAAPGREDWPAAFVIPTQQPDPATLAAMLRILQRGQVEIRRATAPFSANGVQYAPGTYVIPMAQPYGGFAKALLENQRYPDLREYPGGPPKRPYDVTAHTLPLLMGVNVAAVMEAPSALSEPIGPVAPLRLQVRGLSGKNTRRIALYRSYMASMDEGWTRWVLEQHGVPYTSVVNRDILAGKLNDRFDVIIIPDQNARALNAGVVWSYPDSLRGGLAGDGVARLKEFVANGGTLVTFNNASMWAVDALGLPVRNALAGVSAQEFYAPGSIFAVELNAKHPLARGMTARPAVWFQGSPVFEITDPSRATAVATYPSGASPLISGWLLGGEKLAGKAALVEVREGKGRVVLFGFRPQYRGQSMATYPLIWGALGQQQ
jgi:hypothetical protein